MTVKQYDSMLRGCIREIDSSMEAESGIKIIEEVLVANARIVKVARPAKVGG